ncbi:ribose-phosphate pyrophosphokinase [Candidatus Marinimicrobia bacterium MT.SAG.3]|nr:ribose-phosphate pyrophosphokinase [Candidatus Marinimicrobia bacterium MT.SAG.3]
MGSTLKIFSGRSNMPLAEGIANSLGQPLGKLEIVEFKDGELYVKYEENIRGCDVFIIQSTNPPAKNFLELFLMIDAARRASAKRITAVIPYYGYARQDRKNTPRVALSAKLFANMIIVAGADRVMAMDLHSPQIQGFFDVPFDHLYSSMVLIEHLSKMDFIENAIIMAPDIGGIKMARAYARRLDLDLAVIDKRREKANKSEVMNIIGEIEGKNVILLDDLVDTAGTLINAADAALEKGAINVYTAAAHPVLSGDSIERLRKSAIKKLIVTDTIPLPDNGNSDILEVVSVAEIFGKAIMAIHEERSISTLFDSQDY